VHISPKATRTELSITPVGGTQNPHVSKNAPNNTNKQATVS
jgi:hypothetical protein